MNPGDRVAVNHRDSFKTTSGEVVHIGSINGEPVTVLVRLDVGGYRHFDLDQYEISPEF